MTKALPLIAALACAAAIASPGPAAAADPTTAGELKALCRANATECTQYLVGIEVVAVVMNEGPFACFMKADYSPPGTFRPDKMAALIAWMDAHPDPAASAEVFGRRTLLAVFPETPACRAEFIGGG